MKQKNYNPKLGISLEVGERIVLEIKRTKIIPILIFAGACLASILLFALYILINAGNSFVFALDASGRAFFLLVIAIVLGTVWIATLISLNVYTTNKLFVTNKRLIQRVANSLFDTAMNVIDLVSVEDVSFKQAGLFEHLFEVGTLRMSTIGDETTYVFKYLDTPTDELETITHYVHIEKGEIPADDECEVPADTDKKSLSEILAAKKNQKPEAKPETATPNTIHIDHRTRQAEVASSPVSENAPETKTENTELATTAEETEIVESVDATEASVAPKTPDTSSDTLNVPNLGN
ncbi:MAG: PH domain-containing protein [Candidatus Nanosynbacter sp.]|nr:PH domain-containing protein [Candidatus Nanosynbacter sp.]